MTIIYNGVAKDTRSEKEKAKDFDAKELLVSSPIIFRNVNSLSEVKKGEIRNQNGAGNCVTQSLAKAIEMSAKHKGYDITLSKSATYPYQNRSNRPEGGSAPVEMCQFTHKNGWYLEKDVPSQNMSDYQIDNFNIAKNIVKEQGYNLTYFVDATPEFEEIAQYVADYGNAMMLVDCDYEGYVKDIPTPNKRNHQIRHEICVVDSITFNGIKYLVMDESWGIIGSSELAQRGQRLITKQAFYGMVEQVIVVSVNKIPEKKEVYYKAYISLPNLQFGNRNDYVYGLQQMLIDAGFMSPDIHTTYYGNLTANALLKWQLENIKDISQKELKSLGGKYFGPASKRAINNLINAGNNPPANNNMKSYKFDYKKFLFSALGVFIPAFLISLSEGIGKDFSFTSSAVFGLVSSAGIYAVSVVKNWIVNNYLNKNE